MNYNKIAGHACVLKGDIIHIWVGESFAEDVMVKGENLGEADKLANLHICLTSHYISLTPLNATQSQLGDIGDPDQCENSGPVK